MVADWFALPAGVMIATIVSAVGIGGGILWMPFLLLLMKLGKDTVIVTSLLIQVAGMGSATFAFWNKNMVVASLAPVLLLSAVPGLILGAILAGMLSMANLELILGAFSLATAFLFVSSGQGYTDTGRSRVKVRELLPYSWAVAAMAVASGMLSISIGEWLIPLLRGRLGLKMNLAVATSIATIFGICVAAAAIHLAMGARADLGILAWAVPGVLVGGQIGPKINEKINDRKLKEIFIFLLTLVAIHMIYNAY